MGNEEWGMRNGNETWGMGHEEWGLRNGEGRMWNVERGTGNGELSGNACSRHWLNAMEHFLKYCKAELVHYRNILRCKRNRYLVDLISGLVSRSL